MKQIIFIFVIIVISILSPQVSTAKILEGNVSLVDEIPQNFYGTWLVTGAMLSTNIENVYNQKSVDVWTLTRYGNIIVLANPLSGAYAGISVNDVEGNTIKFSRTSKTYNQSSYEFPEITLSEDTFEGIDNMIIEHSSNGNLRRKDILKYRIKGKKIASENLF